MCKNLNKKLIYGTPYIPTATGLVEPGIKTLKDLMKTKLVDNCNFNETPTRSLTVMRTTVHSKTKETPFERHYGRKPRTELLCYLILPSNVVLVKPEALQIYSFASKDGDFDQLVMLKKHLTNWSAMLITV